MEPDYGIRPTFGGDFSVADSAGSHSYADWIQFHWRLLDFRFFDDFPFCWLAFSATVEDVRVGDGENGRRRRADDNVHHTVTRFGRHGACDK